MDAKPPVTLALTRTYLNQRFWKLLRILHRCWTWTWRFAVLLLLIDLLIPIIGNKYVPPRRQPKAQYGLSLVHPQANPIFPQAVDIVFVHGLGAFPDTTWQHRPEQSAQDTASGQPVSWVRDLLAQDIREARLMFFNYDSTTYNDAPQKDLQDIGMELLQAFDVARLRQSPLERNRPIIFLCHSYGGLVLKEALVQLVSDSNDNQDILQNTRGIIFLGTPHRGTKYSDYGRSAALRLNRLNANPDIFLPLKINSPSLVHQHAKFMERFGNLDMVNFYETRALPMFSYPMTKLWYKDVIVKKFSAIFENATNAPLDSHHSGLNKFGSRSDPGYRKVRFALESMINRIRKQRIETQNETSSLLHEGDSSTSGRTPQCSQGARYVIPFSTVNTYTERPNIMDQVMKELSSFQKFRDPPRSVAFWGIGGSGKSQLALRFVETHRDSYDTIIWIDARSPVAATRSYAVAFERLNLEYPQHVYDQIQSYGDDHDQREFSIDDNWVIQTVKGWLENAVCKWLVVIDNADDLVWMQSIIPRGRMGSLVITSRDRMVYRYVNHAINVGRMGSEEAVALLFRSANIPPNPVPTRHRTELTQQMRRTIQGYWIVDRLGYLALAIDLAGAYISLHDLVQEDLSLYLDFLNENSVALLGNEVLQDEESYHHNVKTVWEASFAAINKSSPDSAVLFIFLAYLSTPNTEDRLFNESSFWLYQQRMAHSVWKAVARTLEAIFCFLIPAACAHFLKANVPWKPNLRGQALLVVKTLLILMPIIFGVITFVVVGSLKKHNVSKGNVMLEDRTVISRETIIILLELGLEHSAPTVYNWLLPEDKGLSFLRGLALRYASAVCMLWVYEVYMSTVSEKVAMHATGLLEQLDFSHSSKGQCSAVIRKYDYVSERTRRWQFVLMIAWVVFSLFVLYYLVTNAILLLYLLWLHAMVPRPARIKGRKLSNCMKATTSRFGFEIFYGTCFVISLYVLDRIHIFDWILNMGRGTPALSVSPLFVNSLLKTNLNGQWNPRIYSDVMAPLTRFSLMQREADSAYSMHVLVRWWARNRLPLAMQHAWIRETERFLSMSYSSKTCWSDPLCHRVLIPHLIEVAILGANTGALGFETVQDVLRKLYRSLSMVQKSYRVASDG